jgi:hypothetical protein
VGAKKRLNRIALCASLAACAAALSVPAAPERVGSAQTRQTNPRPAPTQQRPVGAAVPGKSAAPTPGKLPDYSQTKVELKPQYFAPTKNPNLRPNPAYTPFTAQELKQKGGARVVVRVDPQTKAARTYVSLKRIDPATKAPRLVPVDDYVARLNEVEQYLNGVGYSLRSGPQNLGRILSLKKRPMPDVRDQVYHKPLSFDPATFNPLEKLRRFDDYAGGRAAQGGSPKFQGGVQLMRKMFTRPRATLDVPLPGWGAGVPRKAKADITCGCTKCGGTVGVPMGEPCLEGIDPKTGAFTPCKARGGGGGTSKGYQVCGKVPAECRAACLYDGYLAGHWPGIAESYPGFSLNGWFGGNFEMLLGSSNCGAAGALNLSNGASAAANLLVFGVSIPVLDAHVAAGYDGQPQQDYGFSFLGREVSALQLNHSIQGPTAVIPIPPVPVPITIKTGLDMSLAAGQPKFTFPELSPSDCNRSGTLAVDMGVDLDASLSVKAAIDAYVLEVGMEGKLIFVDDWFGPGLATEVRPAQNEVVVRPAFRYRMRHLAGELYLYAEVDYLFGSKRWEVQILDLDSGLGTPGNKVVTVPIAEEKYQAAKQAPAGS